MDDVDSYIDGVISREGGYSNHIADRGGETKWGITLATARAYDYTEAMSEMSRDTAKAIYRTRYWTQPGFDRLATTDAALAGKLFDIGVNMGPATGIQFMQRALNVLNQQERVFPDIAIDGGLGPMTLAALNAFLTQRGADGRRVLLAMVAALQSVRYVELAEQAPDQEAFQYGWQLNRALGAET
jgi:lysozyme family protein